MKNLFLFFLKYSCLIFLTISCTRNVFDIENNGQSTKGDSFNPGLDPIPLELTVASTEVSNQSVTIVWSDSTYAVSYDLYFREIGSANFSKIKNVRSPQIISGLTNNITYEFKILAVNLRGTMSSNIVQATPVNGSSSTAEFVPSSHQLIRTVGNRHIVQGSLSGMTDQLFGTSARGYRIFFNSQGQILGEQ